MMELPYDPKFMDQALANSRGLYCDLSQITGEFTRMNEYADGLLINSPFDPKNYMAEYLSKFKDAGIENVKIRISPSRGATPWGQVESQIQNMGMLLGEQAITPHVQKVVASFVCKEFFRDVFAGNFVVKGKRLTSQEVVWKLLYTSILDFVPSDGIVLGRQKFFKQGLQTSIVKEGKPSQNYIDLVAALKAQICTIPVQITVFEDVGTSLLNLADTISAQDLGSILFQVLYTIRELSLKKIRHNSLDVFSIKVDQYIEDIPMVYFLDSDRYAILETKYYAKISNFSRSVVCGSQNPLSQNALATRDCPEGGTCSTCTEKFDLFSFVASLYSYTETYCTKHKKPEEAKFKGDLDDIISDLYQLTVLDKTLLPVRFQSGSAHRIVEKWYPCNKTNQQGWVCSNNEFADSVIDKIDNVLMKFAEPVTLSLNVNGYPEELKPIETKIADYPYNSVAGLFALPFYVSQRAGSAISMANRLIEAKPFKETPEEILFEERGPTSNPLEERLMTENQRLIEDRERLAREKEQETTRVRDLQARLTELEAKMRAAEEEKQRQAQYYPQAYGQSGFTFGAQGHQVSGGYPIGTHGQPASGGPVVFQPQYQPQPAVPGAVAGGLFGAPAAGAPEAASMFQPQPTPMTTNEAGVQVPNKAAMIQARRESQALREPQAAKPAQNRLEIKE